MTKRLECTAIRAGRVARSGLAVVVALLTAVGCGTEDTSGTTLPGGEDTTTMPTTPDGIRPGADLEPLNRLTSFRRSSRPDDLTGERRLTEVVVPASLEEVWQTWGPDFEPAPERPEVPEGHQVVVVWDAGNWLGLDGYRIDDDGALVIVGTRELPGPECVVTAEVGGRTWVLSIDDERVVAGSAIAEPDVHEVVVDC